MGLMGGWLSGIHPQSRPSEGSWGELARSPIAASGDLCSLGAACGSARGSLRRDPWRLGRWGRKGAPTRAGQGRWWRRRFSPRGGPTTCSRCDPSSLATLSRGPARLGCPHASPKPGRGIRQTGKQQRPARCLGTRRPASRRPFAFD